MTSSHTQEEDISFPWNQESTTVNAPRTSKPFRSSLPFVGGLVLGLLPLCLYVLNHLMFSSPLSMTFAFCSAQTYTPEARVELLDVVLPVLYYSETVFSLLFILGVGMVMLIQRMRRGIRRQRNTALFWASGLLLAVILTFVIWLVFLFPVSFSQCFHLVGMR